jgi:hypothetical protein
LRDADIYISDVLRELQLIELGLDQGIVVPNRLRQLALDLLPMLRWARDLVAHAVIGAEDGPVADLQIQLRADAADSVVRLMGLVAELQFFARQGSLFVEPSEEVLGLLEWFVSESIGQLDGEAPQRHQDLTR